MWAIADTKVYDLTNYVYSAGLNQNGPEFTFLDQGISDLFQQRKGQDVTTAFHAILNGFNQTYREMHTDCLTNAFYIGEADFRKSARCQVQNYLLIIISGILIASVLLKCACSFSMVLAVFADLIFSSVLAALQLSTKRSPELQDKFVLCQVPCYTEDEDSLRRTIDSLAALNYDDKRKLIFIICDGNIIGSGNDRTTPRIVLDILGVDPKLDPEPLMFKSVGEGMKALNYGKIYSGLYEFEGHVVPYVFSFFGCYLSF